MTRQILKLLINARHWLGPTARLNRTKLGDHGDHSFLSENAVDQGWKLAGSFIEQLQSRLDIKVVSDHSLWTWAGGRARWVLNRFQLVHTNLYMEDHTSDIWQIMGNQSMATSAATKGSSVAPKVESQDTYILTDGTQIVLSKCITRTDQE